MNTTGRLHPKAPARPRVPLLPVIRVSLQALAALTLLAVAACGPGTGEPPAPGEGFGVPPDLRGRRVMLLPVQINSGVRGNLDAELRFALTDRGREVEWIHEEDIEDALRRAPAIRASTRGLPVSAFTRGLVERVGDPLYGQLRRMTALVEADAILLPVEATYEPNETIVNSLPRVRFAAAIIEPRTGRVLWYGIEEGLDVPQSDPRGLASAAESLAGAIFWYTGS